MAISSWLREMPVSYTHLAGMAAAGAFTGTADGGAVHAGVQPVSYTHLDVYKRQVQGTAQMKQYDVKISRMALSDMEQIYSLSLIHI